MRTAAEKTHARGRVRAALSLVVALSLTLQLLPAQGVAWALGDDSASVGAVLAGAPESEGDAPADGSGAGDASEGDDGQSPQGEASAGGVSEASEPAVRTVRIRFDANVAQGDPHPATGRMDDYPYALDGEGRELPANAYAREGHRFAGWSTTSDGRDVPDDPATPDEDESLAATAVPDAQESADLSWDERVADDPADPGSPAHAERRDLAPAVRDGTLTLYAQWEALPASEATGLGQEEYPEATDVQEDEAPAATDAANQPESQGNNMQGATLGETEPSAVEPSQEEAHSGKTDPGQDDADGDWEAVADDWDATDDTEHGVTALKDGLAKDLGLAPAPSDAPGNASPLATYTLRLIVGLSESTALRTDDVVLGTHDNVTLLGFASEDMLEEAKSYYEENAAWCQRDALLGMAEGDEAPEGDPDSVTPLNNPLAQLEQIAASDASSIAGSDLLVALVDTGAPDDSAVAASASMLGDEGTDANGHASSVLEAMKGQNANVRVLSIKALDNDGRGSASSVYAAVVYAADNGANIINLSLAGVDNDGNAAIAEAVAYAQARGCVVVAAAGNGGYDAAYITPANVEGVLTVGAADENGEVLASSNRGECVDLYVEATSTSIAAARVSGWLSANGIAPGWHDALLASELNAGAKDASKGSVPEDVSNVDAAATIVAMTSSDGISWTANYVNNRIYSFTAGEDGWYLLEAWGAAGGAGRNDYSSVRAAVPGGAGGYASGYVQLSAGQTIYACVGGMGGSTVNGNTVPSGGYNGGGMGGSASGNSYWGGGGGATSLGLDATTVAATPGSTVQEKKQRLLVVAGGGGGSSYGLSSSSTQGSEAYGGAGGGEEGLQGRRAPWCGFGGTQSAGGIAGDNTYGNTGGSFGTGGTGAGVRTGGGGGGLFGGGGGGDNWKNRMGASGVGSCSGGGGSGYVNPDLQLPSLIDGEASMPSWTQLGVQRSSGNSGSGHVRVTLVNKVTMQLNDNLGADADGTDYVSGQGTADAFAAKDILLGMQEVAIPKDGGRTFQGYYAEVDYKLVQVVDRYGKLLSNVSASVGTALTARYSMQYEFKCTNTCESWEVPESGKYLLEAWGGEGGSYCYWGAIYYADPPGGYSRGLVKLKKKANEKLYLYVTVGGAGADGNPTGESAGGFNGGGKGYRSTDGGAVSNGVTLRKAGGGGGGATHIASIKRGNGLLSNYASYSDRLLLVAGGGGGAGLGCIVPSAEKMSSGGGAEGASYNSTKATQTSGNAMGTGGSATGAALHGVMGGGSGWRSGSLVSGGTTSSGRGGSGRVGGVSSTFSNTYYVTNGTWKDASGVNQTISGGSWQGHLIPSGSEKPVQAGNDGYVRITVAYDYVVTYNANGGIGRMDNDSFYVSDEYTDGEQHLSKNNYEADSWHIHRDGYYFVGWNTKADGSGVSYTDGERITKENRLSNKEYDSVTGAGVVDLYAQWVPTREAGEAYAVLQSNGEVVFFRSDKGYASTSAGPYTDIAGNTYTGTLFSVPEAGVATRDDAPASWDTVSGDQKLTVTSVRVAEFSPTLPGAVAYPGYFYQALHPTTMEDWFLGCTNLTSAMLNEVDTAGVVSMKSLFEDCSSLVALDLSVLDAGGQNDEARKNACSVTSMENMFSGCSALSSLDISHFDTSSATTMKDMFAECAALTSVKLGKDFSFKGAGIPDDEDHALQAILPTHASSDPPIANGHWRHETTVSTGEEDEDSTSRAYLWNSAYLRDNYLLESYAADADLLMGTWTWEYLIKITLDQNLPDGVEEDAAASGTVWELPGKGVYLDEMCETPFDVAGANPVAVPSRDRYEFQGYNSIGSGSGDTLVDKGGNRTDTFANDYFSGDASIYAMWRPTREAGYAYAVVETDDLGEPTGNLLFFRSDKVYESGELGTYTDIVAECYLGATITGHAYTGYVFPIEEVGEGVDYEPGAAPWDAFQDSICAVSVAEFPWDDSGYFYQACHPASTAHWFDGCENLTSCSLNEIDTSGVESMQAMFRGCAKLGSISLDELDWSLATVQAVTDPNTGEETEESVPISATGKVTNMSHMFDGCAALSTLTISKMDTGTVTTMDSMFKGCAALPALALGSGFVTTNVTIMGSMFEDCAALTSLDLSGFDTSRVTAMNSLFSGCSKLSSLTRGSGFVTSNVTDMGSLFQGTAFTELDLSANEELGIPAFDTSKVTDMSSMFANCSKLNTLDISSFNTHAASNMTDMLNKAEALYHVNLGTGFSFAGSSLEPLAEPKTKLWDGPEYYRWEQRERDGLTDEDRVRMSATSLAGAYNYVSAATMQGWYDLVPLRRVGHAYAVVEVQTDPDTGEVVRDDGGEPVLTSQMVLFRHELVGDEVDVANGSFATLEDIAGVMRTGYIFRIVEDDDDDVTTADYAPGSAPWAAYAGQVTSVSVAPFPMDEHGRTHQRVKPASTAHWFEGFTELVNVSLDEVDTSEVVSMASMFEGCESLTKISLDALAIIDDDGAPVTQAGKVQDFSSMLKGCSAVTTLEVGALTATSATTMASMFKGCSAVEELDLSGFSTPHVTDLSFAFDGCESLVALDIRGMDTTSTDGRASVEMAYMLDNCSVLERVTLGTAFSFKSLGAGEALTKLREVPADHVWAKVGATSDAYRLSASDLASNFVGTTYAGTWVIQPTREAGRAYAVLRSDVGHEGELLFFRSEEAYQNDTEYESAADIVGNVYAGRVFVVDEALVGDTGSETKYAPASAPWAAYADSIVLATMAEFPWSDSYEYQALHPASTAYWFDGCETLTFVSLPEIDTAQVTRMEEMFDGCSSLQALDVRSMSTERATSMQDMFRGCTLLSSVTIGDAWSFKGAGTNVLTELPSVNAAGRQVSWSNESYVHTAAELAANYLSSAGYPAGRWVWDSPLYEVQLHVDEDAELSNAGERSEMVWEWFEAGLYLNEERTSPFDSVHKIVVPSPAARGTRFAGYYTQENGQGERLIDSAGRPTTAFTSSYFHPAYTAGEEEVASTLGADGKGHLYAYFKSDAAYAVLVEGGDGAGTLYFIRSGDELSEDFAAGDRITIHDTADAEYTGRVWPLDELTAAAVLSAGDVPWQGAGGLAAEERASIISVVSFAGQAIEPETTAWWFKDLANLAYADLSGFATQGVTQDMQSMFDGCDKLSRVVLPATFSFKGSDIADASKHAVLPTPNAAEYTGRWTDGSHALTAEGLVSAFPSSAAPAGTWYWERQIRFPMTGGAGQGVVVAWIAAGAACAAAAGLRRRRREQ